MIFAALFLMKPVERLSWELIKACGSSALPERKSLMLCLVIIVRDEIAAQKLREVVGRVAVLYAHFAASRRPEKVDPLPDRTLYESKGMEFDDASMTNFSLVGDFNTRCRYCCMTFSVTRWQQRRTGVQSFTPSIVESPLTKNAMPSFELN